MRVQQRAQGMGVQRLEASLDQWRVRPGRQLHEGQCSSAPVPTQGWSSHQLEAILKGQLQVHTQLPCRRLRFVDGISAKEDGRKGVGIRRAKASRWNLEGQDRAICERRKTGLGYPKTWLRDGTRDQGFPRTSMRISQKERRLWLDPQN